jgi:hypothetical protein
MHASDLAAEIVLSYCALIWLHISSACYTVNTPAAWHRRGGDLPGALSPHGTRWTPAASAHAQLGGESRMMIPG